jgi:hypothetical protein
VQKCIQYIEIQGIIKRLAGSFERKKKKKKKILVYRTEKKSKKKSGSNLSLDMDNSGLIRHLFCQEF